FFCLCADNLRRFVQNRAALVGRHRRHFRCNSDGSADRVAHLLLAELWNRSDNTAIKRVYHIYRAHCCDHRPVLYQLTLALILTKTTPLVPAVLKLLNGHIQFSTFASVLPCVTIPMKSNVFVGARHRLALFTLSPDEALRSTLCPIGTQAAMNYIIFIP